MHRSPDSRSPAKEERSCGLCEAIPPTATAHPSRPLTHSAHTLVLLALFLLGTVVVLSSITYYLAINPDAYLTVEEVGYKDTDALYNATALGVTERIPRILHQTWKSETLPAKWENVSQGCRDMMPD